MTTKTTAITPDRAMRADARRNHARVLSAARKCMGRDGLEAGMDEIARCAKVGVGTVYRHFPNKDDLVEALAADRFQRLAELASEALEREDPRQAFDDFVRASARIQSEDRALSEVLTSRPETMRRAAEGVDMLGLVAEVLGRAQAAGAIREDTRPEDVPMLMCALAGTYRNPFNEPERYVSIVLDGLRAPGSTPLR
ncbi:MAG: TetR/AcrR family transcriptional regulator [Solirubrobacterales bacterium]